MATPHDALFRRLFSDRAIAAEAIRSALPSEVAVRLDLSTLAMRPTAHVDEALHPFHSDLVFEARLAEREALVLLLVEHQSTPDDRMPFRLLQPGSCDRPAALRPARGHSPPFSDTFWKSTRGSTSTSSRASPTASSAAQEQRS